MSQLVAHKSLRDTSIGLGGKPYKVDSRGVLRPQPEGMDRKEILLLRAIHLLDDEVSPVYHPGLVPKYPEVGGVLPPRTSVTEVMGLTQTLDGVVPADTVKVLPMGNLMLPPDDDSPDAIDYGALSYSDLLELARSRGIPGLKGKTKAQLLTLVKGA